MTREDLIGRLRRLSAEDCLLQIARIGARLYANPHPSKLLELQRSLVLELSGEGAFSEVVVGALEDGRWRAVYFEQQLVHLARLVLLYADPRPHDDFAGGALYD